MQIAELINLVTFTRAAARDFVSGTISRASGYKILTGKTIGSANMHIKEVISIGLLMSDNATTPSNMAIVVTKIIAALKHLLRPNLVSSLGLEKLTIANDAAIAP